MCCQQKFSSASLLPSVQKLWQFARHTQLPDANITAGPAAPPAQRAVAKEFSHKPTLSSKARYRAESVAIAGAVTKPPRNGVQDKIPGAQIGTLSPSTLTLIQLINPTLYIRS